MALRYDPVANPGGVRCDLYDHAVNIWGRDPETGFARRPLDNVGIQYGLKALNDGAITTTQFLDLNAHVGGFDADANIVPARTVADPVATRRAYSTGRITNGGLGMAQIPIVDYRAYNDDAPGGDIHVRYHSFSMRERLRKANGDAANQVMLVEDQRYGLYNTESPLLQHAIRELDRWITNIRHDPRHRLAANRPASLREGCNTRDEQPTFIARDAAARPVHALRAALPLRFLPARGRRRGRGRRHRQVPAEADRPGRLPRHPHGRRAGPPPGDLPRRRLRLEPPGRRPAAARRHVAELRAAVATDFFPSQGGG